MELFLFYICDFIIIFEACAWGDGRVPDSVYAWLRSPTDDREPLLAPGGFPSAGPGARLGRAHQQGSGRVAIELRAALKLANSDKEALRQWSESLQ
ncbi:MAG: hypothetical protein LBD41_07275 [Clostridiales Family XIII bacterium]|jgi:hypothetical protein|nr:hypothetical protein [Clostridiales Family XIII bacterium]